MPAHEAANPERSSLDYARNDVGKYCVVYNSKREQFLAEKQPCFVELELLPRPGLLKLPDFLSPELACYGIKTRSKKTVSPLLRSEL